MPEPGPQDHVVLGLVARHGPLTPYDLKARVEESIDYFWPIPHAQLYRIPARLAEQGLLREEAEETGRRRRVFHLTDAGRAELERWLSEPKCPPAETRDPAQLKLFFADLGAPEDVIALADDQAARHLHWLDQYRALQAEIDPADSVRAESRSRILELAIKHEQAYVDFWEALARNPTRSPAAGRATSADRRSTP